MSFRNAVRAAAICIAISALGSARAWTQATNGKRPVTPDDYGQWERLGGGTLSGDGKWLVYSISRVNEEDELRLHSVAGQDYTVIPYGSRATFSDDSQWLAYLIGESVEERERLGKEKNPVHNKLGMRNLTTGDSVVIEDVQSFTFSDDGRFLAMRRYGPSGSSSERGSQGVDLVVRTLATDVEMNFGNVAEYAWQDEGTLLAMVISAEGQAGNGVQVFDPATGVLRTLDSKATLYTGLAWDDESDDLAVLRVRADGEIYEDSTYVVLAWRSLSGRRTDRFVFDPDSTVGFPSDTRIVSYRSLTWAEDGSKLFFGIKRRKRKVSEDADTARAGADSSDTNANEEEEEADDEASTVQIWHAADVDIYPSQKVNANRDREENYLAVWHLGAGKFVQLGTDLTEDVTVVKGDRVAIGTDQTPYEKERMFGPVYRDIYRIDVESGDASLIKEYVQYNYGPTPSGKYVLYLEDDQYWVYDVATDQHTNITQRVPTSFVDLEDDHTVTQKPPFGIAGWTEDDRTVLVYDKYDVWQLTPDGARMTNLTNGSDQQIRYRRVRLDPEEEFIDPSDPVYLSTYGEWTKQYGYSRMRLGRSPEQLVWKDANVSRLAKAKNAEVYAYVVQDFDDSPDYFAGGATLSDARQISQTNPFQDDYTWGRSELIEYDNSWGKKLQGALFYPANYEPGRQYPMIVYIYEIRSPAVHTYYAPSERNAYDTSVFTAEGYFVLQPDIVYRDRNPGLSAIAAIEPAVQKVLKTGMVDPDRVGLTGHSWGGYQTAFTVTQTDIFAAAVAGAPLTDLVSMYLSVYWNTGGTDARIFEISQGRMQVPFWEDVDSYIANSPVFHVDSLNTPLLVAHGTEDGAVDFNQGVEYYNAARRAGKDFVLLVYEGENHSNAKKANQIDYHRRVMEWFGYFLKGEDAPDWISKGVSFLDQEEVKKEKKAEPSRR